MCASSFFFFFSSRRRHTRSKRDWSSDVCSSDLWAYEHAGVEPDVMTVAKALANGVPMGAMLARESIASALGPGTHASTFGGTPFVASVALATLTTLLEEKLPERAARMGRRLMDGL